MLGGGYFSVFKKDFSKSLSSFSCISWLALPLFFVDAATKNVDWNVYLHPITVLLGVILSINLVTRLLSNRVIKPNKLLLSSTFFIYAIHEPYLDQVTKIIAPIIPIPDSEIMANAVVILFYLIYCIFDVFVLVAFYWLLYKMSPQFVGMLSGGRR